MYDMSDPAEKDRMMAENQIYWIDRQREAILEVDPTALVTVSFPAFIVAERPTFPAAVIRVSTADFIDLHVYLGMGLSLEEYVDQFGIAGQTEKPLIMGQFGAARQGYPTVSSAAQALLDWQEASCRHGFDGWLLWFRGSEDYLGMYSGPGDGGVIDDILAPVNNPDPCDPTVEIPPEDPIGPPPVVVFDLTGVPAPIVRSGWTSFSSSRGVRDLAFDHSFNVWTATSGGAVVWREDGTYTKYTWEHGLASNSAQTVSVAEDGAVWVGTYGGGVSRFDGETWQTYMEADGLAGDHVISSAAASDGSVWFGTIYSGVSRFDGESWTSYSYGVTPGFEAVGPVIDIAAGPDGSIWIVAYGGGITHFDGRDWQSYEDENGMLEDGLYFNVTVSDGELWAGAASGDREAGLVHFDGSTWTSHIALSSHVTGTIWAIAAGPDGTIWLSTGEAVLAFDGENWRTIEITDVNAIEVWRDGTVWFGTGLQGLLILSEQNIMALAGDDFLSPYGASSIAAGPAGDLWFAGLDGIAHLVGDRWHRYTSNDGLPADDVDVVVVDPDGLVWVGTDFGAAYFFDGHWTAFTAANSGLVNDDVEALAIGPDGAVWFGTMGGVSRFDRETWITYTTADGLPSDWVFGVAVDDQGMAWFGTDEGISRFDGETWTTFTVEDGLYNLNSNSLVVAPDGTIWVGGINRLFYYTGEAWNSIEIESTFDAPSVTAIAFGPDGSLWCSLRSIGTHPSYGAGRFDGQAWSFYSVGDGLGHVDVNSIAVASDGAVWFGTLAGASRYMPEE
jgi:ligand-binding sensor domain-containing protein